MAGKSRSSSKTLNAPAYTPVHPRGTVPCGRLREVLEVVEQGWTRRMIRADHPVYSARIGWERNWAVLAGAVFDANVLGLYVARGLGKLAWLLPDSDSARYFRETFLPRLLASQDPDGYLGARDAGDYHYPCWELMAESDVLETLLFEHRLTGEAAVGDAARRFSEFLVTDAAFMGGAGYPNMPSTVPGTRWDCPAALFRGMLQSAYALTGDARIPTRLRSCYEHYRETIRTPLETSGTDANWANGHLVNLSLSIQASAVMSLLTANPDDLALGIRGVERAMEIAGQVSGYPVGWEAYEAKDPRKTTEHCNFIEWSSACRTLFSMSGRVRFADWAERALYNGYWGSKTKDGVGLQYQSAPNQLVLAPWMRTKRGDVDPYGVNHGWFDMQHVPGCCNAFSAEAFPRHIEHAVARGPFGGVAVVYYMPCRFKVPLENNNGLELLMDTDYPFEDCVRLELRLAQAARFPLELRIPTWVRGAVVTVNGAALDVVAQAGSMLKVEREWKSGDLVEIAFDFPLQLAWHREQGCVPGAAIQRGPLVFALPVEARWEFAGEGQPGPDNIRERWHLFPAAGSFWNAALDVDPKNLERSCRLVRRPNPGSKKAWQYAPVGLQVRGRRVAHWGLAGTPEKPETPPMPAAGMLAFDGSPVDLTLLPMGCTELRMTCLPFVER
ncbi:MAG: glycoside hydrolase family 127 protein [Lentisphaerae bacterium]|nr:glycoside hydrolase family 127 protein [Lentisphaerota bacterium]